MLRVTTKVMDNIAMILIPTIVTIRTNKSLALRNTSSTGAVTAKYMSFDIF